MGRTWSCRSGRIELSARLRTSFARSYPKVGLIRLNPVLLKPSYRDLLPEILCHELAHLAVYELFGPGRKPHGPEWQALVEKAGFTSSALHRTSRQDNRNGQPDYGSDRLSSIVAPSAKRFASHIAVYLSGAVPSAWQQAWTGNS